MVIIVTRISLLLLFLIYVCKIDCYLIDADGKEIIPTPEPSEQAAAGDGTAAAAPDDDVLAEDAVRDRPSLALKKRWCHRDWPVTNGK